MHQTPDIPRDSAQEIVVSARGLNDLLAQMLVRKGLYPADAEIGAARLIEADLRGIHSHGSRAVWRYLQAIDAGEIDPRAEVIVERETAATAVLNGGMGLGHVAATKGMELAVRKAREAGTGTVAVKRSQHYGAAGLYALMAVEAGMIGFTTTNTGPATVAAYGSRQPATTNNALAWGVPTRSGPPFVLDMACAVTSWGKVESLRMYGGELPPGWALDAEGRPTSDPHAAKVLLPFAGARGYGTAFVCSALTGALVGARMPLHKSWSMAADGSEHFFYAIDVEKFVDAETFYREVDSTIAAIRELSPAESFDKVRIPGELEWERANRWREEDIPIHRDHARKLEELASAMSLEVPW